MKKSFGYDKIGRMNAPKYKYTAPEPVKTVSVLDAVKEVSDVYLADYVSDWSMLPSDMAVEEFGSPVVAINVLSRQRDRLLQTCVNWGASIVYAEDSMDADDFVQVKIAGGNLEAILTSIEQQRILTSTEVRMQSKPELRVVGRNLAYGSRQRFAYEKMGLGYIPAKDRNGNAIKVNGQDKLIPVTSFSVEEMDEGNALRLLGTTAERTLLHTKNGGSRYYKNGTDMLLSLELIGLTAEVKDNPVMPVADSILKHGIYLIRSKGLKNGVGIGIVVEINGKQYVQIFNQKTEVTVDASRVDDWKRIPMDRIKEQIKQEQKLEAEGKTFDRKILHYESFFQSPSMTRQKTLLMVNTTDKTREALVAMVDKASCGAFSIMQEAYKDQELSAEKAIKKIGRLSLMMTGSTPFGTIENFMFFYGELSAYDSVFHDGQAYHIAEALSRAFLEKGLNVSPIECLKFVNQARFGAVKGYNLETFLWIVELMIRRILEKGIADGVIVMPKTRESAVELEKNQDGRFNKWLVMITNQVDKPVVFKTFAELKASGLLDKLDYFGDSTNVKCMFDFSQKLEYCLMDFPVRPKGHALSSRQVCNVAQTHPEFLPTFIDLGKATVDRILEDDMADTDLTTDDSEYDEGDNVNEDISQKDYSVDLLSKLIPGIDKMDNNIRRSRYRGTCNSINKMANRFNFRVEGANFKIVGDLAGWFGARLIQPGEVFANGYPTANILEAVAFRHPLCGEGEHMVVHFVTKEELFKRIDVLVDEKDNPLDEDYKKALRVMIKYLAPGVCMIPSTYDFVAAYFSGADFDGDSITVIWEKTVVEMFKTQPQYYVKFGGHNAAKEKFRFGYDLIPGAFRYQYGIGGGTVNASIGMLAGYNVTVLGLLVGVMLGKISPIFVRNLFRKDEADFVDKEIKGNYRRLYKGNVDFTGKEATFVSEFMNAVAKAGNSEQEVIDILRDLNVIISKCMNDIIDAAKTGDKVLVPYMDTIRKRVRAGSVATADYGKIELMPGSKLALKPLQLTVTGRNGELSEKHTMKKWFPGCAVCQDAEGVYVFEDTLTTLRNEILSYAYGKLNEELAVPVSDQFGAYQTQDERLHNTFVLFASQYADLMKTKSDDKRLLKAALANFARIIMKDFSKVPMDQLIYEARIASNYEKDKSNGFYLSFVSELAHFYVGKFCPDKLFTARVYKFGAGTAELGQELSFKKGFAQDNFYADTKVDGTFTLDVSNEGNAVIRKPVREMIPKVEMDSTVLLELKNKSDVAGLNYPTGDKLLDKVEKARIAGSKFSIEYADKATGRMAADYHNTSLALCVDGVPVAAIRIPGYKSYFFNALLHKRIAIEQTEAGTRGTGKSAEKVVYIVGTLPQRTLALLAA